MNRILLKLHMPFSWWRMGNGLLKPTPQKVAAYMQALKKEIASLGEDLEDIELSAIHFEGGYMGLLLADDFEAMLATIHRAFKMTDDCEISGTVFPGSLDMQLISTYRNHNTGPVLLEVPSILMRECEALQIPNVMQLLDHSQYLMEAYGQQSWGITVPRITQAGGAVYERSASTWLHYIRELARYQPPFILFEDGTELFSSAVFAQAAEFLQRVGYRKVSDQCWTTAIQVPQFLTAREYAAVGLDAVSCLDGYITRNTNDMNLYLQRSADYRDLLVSVEAFNNAGTGAASNQ